MFDIVDIDDISMPCFCLPAVDQPHIDIRHVGKNHSNIHSMSLFYVIDPLYYLCLDRRGYGTYRSLNTIKTPWGVAKCHKKVYNNDFYLSKEEMMFIRDIVNTK